MVGRVKPTFSPFHFFTFSLTLFPVNISIIGNGKLGGALAIALTRKGYVIENLISSDGQKKLEFEGINQTAFSAETIKKIASDVILICVQDFNIGKVAENLAENLVHKPTVLHTSGSLSSDILHKLKKNGCPVGSLHPLVSISDAVLGANRFADVFYCVEGEPKAVEIAKKIVADLGGKSFEIDSNFKTLYHASAVTACGHLVALIDVAVEMLGKCGLKEMQSREILLPLIASTVENLKTQTTAEALTGTFARADSVIFEKHLETLKENVSPEAVETYLQLGERSVHLAELQGADKNKLEILRNKISLAKKFSKW